MSLKLLTNFITILKEMTEKEGVIYIDQDNLLNYLKTVSYNMDVLSKTKKFKGKDVVVTTSLDLSNVKIETLGPIKKVSGRLDISGTDIASLEGVEVTGYVSDYNSKMYRIRRAKEEAKIRAVAQSRRESGDWDDITNDYNSSAQALFQYLKGRDDLQDRPENLQEKIDELEDRKSQLEQMQAQSDGGGEEYDRLQGQLDAVETEIDELNDGKYGDVYDLIPEGQMYGLVIFKSKLPDSFDEEYFIGRENKLDRALEEYFEQYVDDVGIEGFNSNVIEDNLDEDRLRSDIEDVYENDIRDNPESYLDDSDKQLSRSQQEEVQSLNKEQLELEEKLYVENISPESEEGKEIKERISEIESEIEDINDSPDGEYKEDSIQEKIEDTVDYYMNNYNEFFSNMGSDISDYLDKDALVKYLVRSEDYGVLSGYDGSYETEKFNDKYYYIFRHN